MNYNEARAEILPRWEEILQRITSPAKKQGSIYVYFADTEHTETDLRRTREAQSMDLSASVVVAFRETSSNT